MDPIIESDISPLKKKFHSACRWIVCGSVLFETGRVIHLFFLIKYLANPALYGIIGTLFSTIYLTARIIDFGATNSLPPYWLQLSQSKQNFQSLLIRYFMLPSIPLALIAPFVALYFFTTKLPHTSLYLFIIPPLIILETIRSFFRLFLHLAGKTSRVVSFELFSFVIFLCGIWIPLLFFNANPGINQLFIPFLIDTLLSVGFILFLVFKIYKKLPDIPPTINRTLWQRLSQVRLLNFLLRISRDIFSNNLLVPIFATKCGLAQAGLFYFASQLARLLQEVLKGPLVYAGNSMLAELKDGSLAHKKTAFSQLSQKLMSLLLPMVIFLAINYRALARIAHNSSTTGITINFTLLFLLITLSESLFIMYEQFYIIEEAAIKLFLFKLIDFSLFYLLILSQNSISPIPALLAIIGIRALSLTLIAANAYFSWRVVPNINIGWCYTTSWTILALATSYAIPKLAVWVQ